MNNLKRMMSFIMILVMIISVNENMYGNENNKIEEKREYLLVSNKDVSQVVSKYEKQSYSKYTEEINNNNIYYVEMTNSEKEDIENKNGNIVIEENVEFAGSSELLHPKDVDSDWNLEMINADNSETEEIENKVKIAIIDSGIDECQGINVKERINLIPEEDGVSPCFDDMAGHGTAIAGIIAGEAISERESKGINTDVELYSIKVLDGNNKAPLSRVVEAIYKAIEHEVDIINMSFGTTTDSQILYQAIRDAYDAGILLVAAAGNRGEIEGAVEYPAAYNEVLSVGSVDSNGNIAKSSSYGINVDVMAPGECIKTATNFGLETVGTGTSLAVPHVVGIASILWQKDLSKPAEFVRRLIQETSNKEMYNGVEYSIVDLSYALDKYDEFQINYTDKDYEIRENSAELTIDENMEEVTARWLRDDHAALVANNKNTQLTTKEVNMIKAGSRYNDRCLPRDRDGDGVFEENERPANIWHSLGSDANFMSAMYFVGKIIQQTNCVTSNVATTPGLTEAQAQLMRNDIDNINWTEVWNITGITDSTDYPSNIKNKRLLLFGMTLHIATDAFAHKAYKRKPYLSGASMSHWEHVSDTDNPNEVSSRFSAAGKVVKNAMDQCLNFENGSVVMKDTYTIRSKQIMYNNSYFDSSFLIGYLYNNAMANSANDNTFTTWEGELFGNTYNPAFDY